MKILKNNYSTSLRQKTVSNVIITKSQFVRYLFGGLEKVSLFNFAEKGLLKKWERISFYSLFKRRLYFWKRAKYYFVFNIWGQGYHHWLTEVVVKLVLFETDIKSGILIVPESHPNFIREFLECSGFTSVREMKGNVFLPEVTVFENPTSGHYNPFHLIMVKDYIFKNFCPDISHSPTLDIYITRKNSRGRKVVNDEELSQLLASRGFQIIDLDNLPFREQVKMFRNCRSILSIHGAGLTNVLFMQAGTRMIELFPEVSDPEVQLNPCYYRMCTILDVSHKFVFCQRENPGTPFDLHNDNIVVCKDDIENLISLKQI